MFGTDRLQALLAAERAQDVETVLERVESAARTFRAGTEPLDDVTMMVLRLRNSELRTQN